MKLNQILWCKWIVLVGLITILLSNTVLAEEQMEIMDYDYTLVDQYTIGQRLVSEYNISVVVKNNGTSSSSELMEIQLEDNDIPDSFVLTYDNFTLPLGESKTIYFEWSATFYRDYTINLTLQPMDPNARKSENTDFKSFIIDITGSSEEEQTPGFHIGLVIIVILITFIIKKKKMGM